tara:strand:- start:111 stop:341 length:231 start_codon:yes stop_codon:yes gene_type:complete
MFSRIIYTPLRRISILRASDTIYNPFSGKVIPNGNPMCIPEMIEDFFPESSKRNIKNNKSSRTCNKNSNKIYKQEE